VRRKLKRLKKLWGASIMLNRVKEDLFTVHGLITTLLHVAFVVGCITSWVLIQSEILGYDPKAPVMSASPRK
jgi:hypothetical protein